LAPPLVFLTLAPLLIDPIFGFEPPYRARRETKVRCA
jgi:hypothetical protein